MPTTVSEADVYEATIEVPNDGEAANQSSLLTRFVQRLANSKRYFRARAFGAVPSYHYAAQLSALNLNNFVSTVLGGPGTNAFGYVQGATPASTNHVLVPIFVPGIGTPTHAPKLTSVQVSVRPANGHGALPATQWSCAVYRQGTSGGAPVLLAGPTTDTAGTVVAYEALRQITLTVNAVLTTSDSYYAIVFGEGGANAIQGLLLTRIGVTVDPE